MTNKQLAAHYGVTLSAVNKWSKEKRAALIREIEAGVNPEIKRLIGELAQLCYVVQCKTGKYARFFCGMHCFTVEFLGENIVNGLPLNALALQGAITKLEELLK